MARSAAIRRVRRGTAPSPARPSARPSVVIEVLDGRAGARELLDGIAERRDADAQRQALHRRVGEDRRGGHAAPAAGKLVGIPRRASAVISSTSLPAMSVNRAPLAFNASAVAVKSSYRGSVTMYRRGPSVWTILTRGIRQGAAWRHRRRARRSEGPRPRKRRPMPCG